MASFARIARAISRASARSGLDLPATLIVVTAGTRTVGAVSAGANPTEARYVARGNVMTWNRKLLNVTEVLATDRVVALLGATIEGGQVPKIGDKITIESVTSKIVDIVRDPALAQYVCLTRGVFVDYASWSSGFSSGFGG